MAYYKKYSDEEENKLIELYKEHKDIEKISEEIGRSKPSIIQKLLRLKLYDKEYHRSKRRKKNVNLSTPQYIDLIEEKLGTKFERYKKEQNSLSRKENLKILLEAIIALKKEESTFENRNYK